LLTNKKGLTLIELVVAMGLIIFVLSATMGVAISALNLAANSKLKAQAVEYTQEVMNECIFKYQKDPTITTCTGYSTKPASLSTVSVSIVKNFTAVPGGPDFDQNNFTKIKVSVTWKFHNLNSTYFLMQFVPKKKVS
jgi:type II secretory pathway pseudopilin PulG